MLSIERFSVDTCQRLLGDGYTHFVVKFRIDQSQSDTLQHVVAFEATKAQGGKKRKTGIPIDDIMDLTENNNTKYYIIHHYKQAP